VAEGADPESKTEEATPRKLAEARKKGDVAKSPDVASALSLLGAAAVILVAGGVFATSIAEQLLPFIAAPHTLTGGLDAGAGVEIGARALWAVAPFLGAVMLATILGGAGGNLAQSGLLFTASKLKPDWSRVNPLAGFKRIFGPDGLVQFVKTFLKLAAVGVICWLVLKPHARELENLAAMHPAAILPLARDLAVALGMEERQVMLASTGIIGRYLPVQKMHRAIPTLIRSLSHQGHRPAARAILTTDTSTKEVAVADRIGGIMCRLGGMAKGAGMIAPHMATMLCVLTTDAAIDRRLLEELLRRAVDASFNHISIDGDMSTNDSVFLLANGRSGVTIARHSRAAKQFASMLSFVTQRLAHLLVKDGEGTTCMAYVGVSGARTEAEAHACARQVAASPLVKTMLAGADPNVGRIAAAVGASGARFDPKKLEIRIGGLGVVVRAGAIRPFDAALARKWLRPQPPAYPALHINLRAGRAASWMLTSDLTEEYVRINARYST